MKSITTLCFITLALGAFSQTSFKEREVKTEIREVTVFLSGAQIFETGNASIPEGKTLLRIKNLSPFLDEKSVQVKTDGDFMILSVNHRLNYLSAIRKDKTIDSLHTIIESIDKQIDLDNARLEVLREKQSLLNENKRLGGESGGVTMTQLKLAIELFEAEHSAIRQEQLSLNRNIGNQKEKRAVLESQLKELNDQPVTPWSEIEIRVSSEKAVTGKLTLSYIVDNAGWYPKYDLRVKDVKSPLQLTYKAEVFQNTGVDWKNVKLRFSNGDPRQSGVAPELTRWNLDYARNTVYEAALSSALGSAGVRTVQGRVLDHSGIPLPGVSVLVKGSTIGTVTDVNGNYSLTLPNGNSTLAFSFIGYVSSEIPADRPRIDIRLQEDVTQLSEVVVTGYAMSGASSPIRIRGASTVRNQNRSSYTVPTTVKENQTTVEIEVTTPYSINSNGERLLVELKNHDLPSYYEYYAVPKLDKDAFLIARIMEWDKYNLLEGEANLYFEDAYVGRSILAAKSLEDTLTISMGRDRSIVVTRESNEKFTRRKFIGTNMVDTRAFTITVRNKKSQPIKIIVFDQIPVSVINEISVEPGQLRGGQLDDSTGIVKWDLRVDPQQQKEVAFDYEVRYPKREKVILE